MPDVPVVFRTDETPAGQEPRSEQASTARGLAEADACDGVESGGSRGRDPLRGSCDYYQMGYRRIQTSRIPTLVWKPLERGFSSTLPKPRSIVFLHRNCA